MTDRRTNDDAILKEKEESVFFEEQNKSVYMNELLEAVLPFFNSLQETLSGGQGANPHGPDALPLVSQEGPPPSPNSTSLNVLREPSFIIKYESMEASMRNRILKLERENSIFLLDKRKGEYWEEIKKALNNSASQKDYLRLLAFENRDLQIREKKDECYSLFQVILSQHPTLRETAAYNIEESFIDFFGEKRERLDKNPEWDLAEKDRKEIQFLDQVKDDLRVRGHESRYIRGLLGFESAEGG